MIKWLPFLAHMQKVLGSIPGRSFFSYFESFYLRSHSSLHIQLMFFRIFIAIIITRNGLKHQSVSLPVSINLVTEPKEQYPIFFTQICHPCTASSIHAPMREPTAKNKHFPAKYGQPPVLGKRLQSTLSFPLSH